MTVPSVLSSNAYARAPSSVRGRTLAAGAGVLVLAALLLAVLLGVSAQQRRTLAAGTEAIVQEQRVANEIVHGVMRQLAVVSTSAAQRDSTMYREFDAAGAVVYEGLRWYLFRALSAEERLQIERVKEEHERLEVSAEQALTLPFRNEDEARRVREESVRHAFALMDALDGFVRLREADLRGLFARQADTLRKVSLGGGLLFLTFVVGGAVVVGRFVQRRVTMPLATLATAATRIGEGDLDTRVAPAQDREFQALAEAFNQMCARMAEARDHLTRQNASLAEALHQVQATQAELVQAEKLGALGRMTAGLAHELNSPLATVLGFSELLEARLLEEPDVSSDVLQVEYVQPIVREARRSRMLVRSLLQFARRSESSVGPVQLADAICVVVELRRFAFAQAGIALDTSGVPDAVVVAERQNLQVVLLNIMNNALDALSEQTHGTLTVHGRMTDDAVELHFDDDGPGLADPTRVFEAFYTTKGFGEGTGLGLALAERFMRSFGGTVTAMNRSEGGARFTLRFKRTDAAIASAGLTTPAHESALPARQATHRQHVLVVEDEPHLQRLHRSLLARLDVEIHLVGAVSPARELLGSRHIDLIISDVKMPGESGLQFYDWVLRERPDLQDHFLFVTGDAASPELLDVVQQRPEALLLKPFDAREYLARIEKFLS